MELVKSVRAMCQWAKGPSKEELKEREKAALEYMSVHLLPKVKGKAKGPGKGPRADVEQQLKRRIHRGIFMLTAMASPMYMHTQEIPVHSINQLPNIRTRLEIQGTGVSGRAVIRIFMARSPACRTANCLVSTRPNQWPRQRNLINEKHFPMISLRNIMRHVLLQELLAGR